MTVAHYGARLHRLEMILYPPGPVFAPRANIGHGQAVPHLPKVAFAPATRSSANFRV